MTPKEAIIRLEMDRRIRWLWNDLKSIHDCGTLSDLEAEIWALIVTHPSIQRTLTEDQPIGET